MSIEQELLERSNSSCELCKSTQDLTVFEVSPSDKTASQSALLCSKCRTQFEDDSFLDENHWFCLSDSMWSEFPSVKVLSYRMLKKLGNQDLLDMIYLEESEKVWAEAGIAQIDSGVIHKDCNGVVLSAGDTVTIIKDLDVKGAGFTAKRGTAVRNISLTSNPEHIEGRVNGVKIVILTQYLKKS